MPQKSLRYLALGDSYTIGEMVSPDCRWPYLLVERLKSRNITTDQPVVLAKTGWTTRDLINALDEAEIKIPLDLVSLLIGVNNQYQNLDLQNYQSEFSHLLHRAISFTNKGAQQVIVLSIPDWSVTPFANGKDKGKISALIDQFNEVNMVESQKANVHYFDITTISRQMGDDPTYLSEDYLHPSGKMYTLWVDLIFPKIYQLLNHP